MTTQEKMEAVVSRWKAYVAAKAETYTAVARAEAAEVAERRRRLAERMRAQAPAEAARVRAEAAEEARTLAWAEGVLARHEAIKQAARGGKRQQEERIMAGFDSIVGGGYHNLALKADGSLVPWGWNGEGQCNVPAPNSGFVAVAAGYYHSLGLKADGSPVAWGWNDHGQCNVPALSAL